MIDNEEGGNTDGEDLNDRNMCFSVPERDQYMTQIENDDKEKPLLRKSETIKKKKDKRSVSADLRKL